MDEQDAAMIVADQRGQANAVASIPDPQVRKSQGSRKLAPDAQQQTQHLAEQDGISGGCATLTP
jgi:hypothetical protein